MADDTPMQDAPDPQSGPSKISNLDRSLDEIAAERRRKAEAKKKRFGGQRGRKPKPTPADDGVEDDGDDNPRKRPRDESQATTATAPAARRPRTDVGPRLPPVPMILPSQVGYAGNDVFDKADPGNVNFASISAKNNLVGVLEGPDNAEASTSMYFAKARTLPDAKKHLFHVAVRDMGTDEAAANRRMRQRALDFHKLELDLFDEPQGSSGNGNGNGNGNNSNNNNNNNNNNASASKRRRRGGRGRGKGRGSGPAAPANQKAGAAVDEDRLKANAIAAARRARGSGNNNNNNNTPRDTSGRTTTGGATGAKSRGRGLESSRHNVDNKDRHNHGPDDPVRRAHYEANAGTGAFNPADYARRKEPQAAVTHEDLDDELEKQQEFSRLAIAQGRNDAVLADYDAGGDLFDQPLPPLSDDKATSPMDETQDQYGDDDVIDYSDDVGDEESGFR